jgi:hypothetical protein
MQSNRRVLAVLLNACVLFAMGCDEPLGAEESGLSFEDASVCDVDGSEDAASCVAFRDAGIDPVVEPSCPYDDAPCDARVTPTEASHPHGRFMRDVLALPTSSPNPIAIDTRTLSGAGIAGTLDAHAVARPLPWGPPRAPSFVGGTSLSDLLYALAAQDFVERAPSRRVDPLIAWRLRIGEARLFAHGQTLWVWDERADGRPAIRGFRARDGRETAHARLDPSGLHLGYLLDRSSPLVRIGAHFGDTAPNGERAIALDSAPGFERWLNETRPWDATVDGDRIVGRRAGGLTLGSLREGRTLWIPSTEEGVPEKVVGLDGATGARAFTVALRPRGAMITAAVDSERTVVWGDEELTIIDTETGAYRFLPLPRALDAQVHVGLDRVSLELRGTTAYMLRDGTLVAMDVLDGHVRFVREGWFSQIIAIDDRSVFLSSMGEALVAIDAATGEERWSFGLGTAFDAYAFDGTIIASMWRDEVGVMDLVAFDDDAIPRAAEHAVIEGRILDGIEALSDLDILVGDVRVRTDRRGRFRVRVQARGAVVIVPLSYDGYFTTSDDEPPRNVVVLDGSRRYVVPTLQHRYDHGCGG